MDRRLKGAGAWPQYAGSGEAWEEQRHGGGSRGKTRSTRGVVPIWGGRRPKAVLGLIVVHVAAGAASVPCSSPPSPHLRPARSLQEPALLCMKRGFLAHVRRYHPPGRSRWLETSAPPHPYASSGGPRISLGPRVDWPSPTLGGLAPFVAVRVLTPRARGLRISRSPVRASSRPPHDR